MQSWLAADPEHPSFAARLCQGKIPTPHDRTRSTNMKGPHPIDVASAGSGFRTLKCLDFDDLKISDTETLMWAADLLDRHSPILGEDDQSVWTPPRTIFPGSIRSEHDTATYGKHSLLEPALTAAIFLHATHCDLTPTEAGRHPFGNWAIQDHPTVGSEQVTDLVVARLAGNTAVDPIAVVCAAATYRACCSKGKNMDGVYAHNTPVMHELQRWLDCHNTIPMVPPEQSQEAQTVGRLTYYPEAWQRTIQNLMFQCWHQTVINGIRHTILFNEKEFIFILRDGDALSISDVYQCCPDSTQKTQSDMVKIAYFIAHAMCVRFPPLDHITASTRITPSSEADNAWRWHTDGQTAIRAASGLVTTAMPGLRTTAVPSSLIFTICGSPSPPLVLTAKDQFPGTSAMETHQATTVILSDCLSHDPFRIFRGHFQNQLVIAKIATRPPDRSWSGLQTEYSVYQTLQHLQGSVIPRCYGLFHVEDFACLLLMEDCGRSLDSFNDLSSNQRRILVSHITQIHQCGISHEDLEPRNVLVSNSGRLSIIDFERSERSHMCGERCAELRLFSGMFS